jgi:hypothetical protein
VDEGFDVRGVWRESRQIKAQAPRQRATIGFRRRLEPSRFESSENEAIDRMADPRFLLDGGRERPLGRQKRPVRFELGPLRDPLPQQVLLDLGEILMSRRRRHHFVRVGRKNPPHELAVVRVAGQDGTAIQRLLREIEAQACLAFLGVRAVAGKAFFHQDGSNVVAEPHPWFTFIRLEHECAATAGPTSQQAHEVTAQMVRREKSPRGCLVSPSPVPADE